MWMHSIKHYIRLYAVWSVTMALSLSYHMDERHRRRQHTCTMHCNDIAISMRRENIGMLIIPGGEAAKTHFSDCDDHNDGKWMILHSTWPINNNVWFRVIPWQKRPFFFRFISMTTLVCFRHPCDLRRCALVDDECGERHAPSLAEMA